MNLNVYCFRILEVQIEKPMDKKEILAKLKKEKLSIKKKIEELEIQISNTLYIEYQEINELKTYYNEIESIEDDLLINLPVERDNQKLRHSFEEFTKVILEDNFDDKFYSIFNDFLTEELKSVYSNFLAEKGIMGVLIKLRDYIEFEEKELRKKMLDKHSELYAQREGETFRDKIKRVNKARKLIEEKAKEELNSITEEYLDSLKNREYLDTIKSLQLSESLIRSVGEYLANQISNQIQIYIEEHTTVSKILQENIKERIKRETEI